MCQLAGTVSKEQTDGKYHVLSSQCLKTLLFVKYHIMCYFSNAVNYVAKNWPSITICERGFAKFWSLETGTHQENTTVEDLWGLDFTVEYVSVSIEVEYVNSMPKHIFCHGLYLIKMIWWCNTWKLVTQLRVSHCASYFNISIIYIST